MSWQEGQLRASNANPEAVQSLEGVQEEVKKATANLQAPSREEILRNKQAPGLNTELVSAVARWI
jgi:flagellar assembly factor FliW